MASTKETLIRKFRSRDAAVAVVGLGYVGLPLAVELARVGFRVTGIETDEGKTAALNEGRSYVEDVPSEALAPLLKAKTFCSVTGFDAVRNQDAVLLCVPTPLNKGRDPDMSFIVAASQAIAEHFGPGKLAVLESTTYPGTTEEILLPAFQATGVREGEDFFLAHSPERIDPANKRFTVSNTPKVVGGISPASTEVAAALYGQIVERVVPVSSPAAAEMVKLLENTFRSVNIALVNEVALICDRLGLNVWEIIEAAATKPFGFMPFYPGPGLGGHCIPVDPHYLSWKLRTLNFNARFIELASEINSRMPHYVVDKVVAALNEQGKSVKGSRVLLLGLSYKRDVGDLRESPALDVLEHLVRMGADVRYSDPYIPALNYNSIALHSTAFTEEGLASVDCVVITTDHSAFDYEAVARSARSIVDARNALAPHLLKDPSLRKKVKRL
jgi:UDP-N-acetyl-D-glucosamine dehydrogenase